MHQNLPLIEDKEEVCYVNEENEEEKSENLLLISASDLVIDIKNGKLKCVDLITAYIARIKAVNPILNAVIDERFNEALTEAKHVDELVQKLEGDALWNQFPLLGVPVSVKEPIGVKGLSHTAGDYHRSGVKASEDATVIKFLKEAGAIILCVTNVPEWSMGWETQNPVYGRTLNPYNNHRTTGGSSGGEAALIASAGSVVGVGSDMAGSIRICSSFNGIFGHKPTPNLIPMNGWHPMVIDEYFHHIHTFGPISRYARDLPLLMKVMSGQKSVHLRLDETVDVSKLKIFYIEEFGPSFGITPVQSYIKLAVLKASEYLHAFGCKVKNIHPKNLRLAFEFCSSKEFYLQGVPEFLAKTENSLKAKNITWEWIKCIFHQSKHSYSGLSFYLLYKMKNWLLPETKIEFYDNKIRELENYFNTILKDNAVLVLPTFPTHAFYHYLLPSHLSGVMYTTIFNVLGFPATSVPIMQRNGMPVSVQIVAGPFQDRLCFAVARQLEVAFGGWKAPA
uniref:CSON011536 protein n=1 Tax=Culicoides sonorensis TaxID=179676 RepID=A0A336NAJ7_CULSO